MVPGTTHSTRERGNNACLTQSLSRGGRVPARVRQHRSQGSIKLNKHLCTPGRKVLDRYEDKKFQGRLQKGSKCF
jgi:hypothetical protein